MSPSSSDSDLSPAEPSRRRALQFAAAAGVGLLPTAQVASAQPAAPAAPLPLPEYERFDAVALAAEIRAGAITPSEALEAAIARVEARAALNAIALRHFDAAREQ
ncbi:MAG TPA: twin-arginine translocation signal domain-containing protein, partial [Burkholderiaceae bacterium]|nr:twin-arginine translocation signal domain-containing protein [Burkholderiaceae bacterium]